jgi:hypothetical protein
MRGWKKADCEKEFLFIDGFRAVVSGWKKRTCFIGTTQAGRGYSPKLLKQFKRRSGNRAAPRKIDK